jgi:hypothetical protein
MWTWIRRSKIASTNPYATWSTGQRAGRLLDHPQVPSVQRRRIPPTRTGESAR